jgi:hypothetical protein
MRLVRAALAEVCNGLLGQLIELAGVGVALDLLVETRGLIVVEPGAQPVAQQLEDGQSRIDRPMTVARTALPSQHPLKKVLHFVCELRGPSP